MSHNCGPVHYARAQFNLGTMYDYGHGLPQDYVRAHMWYNLGGANGSENGTKNRDIVASHMSPTAIETAQRLALECMAKNYKGC